MESLPVEILTLIFTFLPPVERILLERVSKSWRKASLHSWASIDKLCLVQDYSEVYDNPNDLIYLKKSVLFINTFDPRIFHSITVRVKNYITSMTINLHDDPKSRRIHVIFTQYFRKLKSLHYDVWPQLDENMLLRIIRRNKELHSIDSLSWNPNIRSLPRRRWRTLRFHHSHWNPSHIESWVNLIIQAINLRSLENFKIYEIWSSHVMEEVLQQNNLRRLDIIKIKSREFLNYIPEISRLQNLKVLYLKSLKIPNDVLVNLLEGLSRNRHGLEELQMYGIEISIEALAVLPTLPKLMTLGIALSPLSDEHLFHLACCKNLSIKFIGNKRFGTFTNDGLINMIKNSEKLEVFHPYALNITPEMFKILVLKTINRPKSITIEVSRNLYHEVLEICKNSKVRIIEPEDDDYRFIREFYE